MTSQNGIENKLLYGDCLKIMRQLPSNSVDLIYLDPPFNSNRAYNAIYKLETGQELPDQVEAFHDVWMWDAKKEEEYKDFRAVNETEIKMWKVIEFFYDYLKGRDDKMLAYLFYMGRRLAAMRDLLKPTGSLYHHCDPTTSHYVKILLDAIFGEENFINEVVWHYTGGGRSKSYFSKKHDILLWYAYSKGKHIFNIDAVRVPYKETSGYAKSGIISKSGKKYMPNPMGTPVDDVWDIPIINPMSKAPDGERLGYPTQKPLALLTRIVSASSNKGGVVLDPFCGCATTLEAAHRLGRKWIGIDIAFHAIKRVARLRLRDRCRLVKDKHFVIRGMPSSLESAKELWNEDEYQFQKWVIEQVDGFVTTRKTADGGIDGRLYFRIKESSKLKSMVLQVKGGKNVGIDDVYKLRGVMEREHDSVMAGLIVMEELGDRKKDNFLREMATAGQIKDGEKQYDAMQLLSVHEILQKKKFKTPFVEGKGSGQDILPLANDE